MIIEEQEAFHSNKSYNFQIPDNIDDFNKSSSKKNTTSTSKINSMFKGNGISIFYFEVIK
ncbi:hypothetical protein RhiirA1_486062 [Rhizophagus irregularis]|uniref:Uncharacterized protein n=1 Tax=Rhizophagus irregularis TaxID=588596 RepID=A0A2N0QHK3_9GLOM|nr:hypothetical protein RhiirA1_486062 [Rhizophagus irregularis]